eukprot:12177087-Alexandrium_andersonii.AAC.1
MLRGHLASPGLASAGGAVADTGAGCWEAALAYVEREKLAPFILENMARLASAQGGIIDGTVARLRAAGFNT